MIRAKGEPGTGNVVRSRTPYAPSGERNQKVTEYT